MFTKPARLSGTRFLAGPAGQPLEAYCTALRGEHQALNATVALAALHHAREAGVAVRPMGIRAGLEQVDWPGRLEVVQPYAAAGARCGAQWGIGAATARGAGRTVSRSARLALIFGVSADKDVSGMFDALLPLVDYLIAAQAVHPRALAPDEIASHCPPAGL